MRKQHVWSLAFALAMTLILPPAADARQPDAKAADAIAKARQALGGEQKLAAVKALSLRASYRRELSAPAGGGGGATMIMTGPGGGAPQATGDIEIDVLFPDKYIKVDTGTGMVAITRTEGFDGDKPLTSVHSNSPHVRIMNDNTGGDAARARMSLERARADLARLLLGLTAGTQPGFPVTYAYVGQAESPDGKAEVIDVKGPDGFAARLFLDSGSYLPLMLTYTAPEPRVMMRTMGGREGVRAAAGATVPARGDAQRTPPELTPEERERLEKERQAMEATPPKMIEFRVFFSEYRDVGGVSLPHRIVRGTASATTEEWEIKSYKVNPSIKADRFTIS